MKALLLAAGLGTRLRPITNDIPKCLVKIQKKPLLEIWLDTLSNVGVTDILINTHYLHRQVEEFINNSIYKDIVTLSYEKELLGTGGTILNNIDFFIKDQPFMVIHADNYSRCDYKEFIEKHLKKPAESIMTMMLFYTDDPKSCGIVELNEHDIVNNFYEKVNNPPSNLANGAVYILDYKVINILQSFKSNKIDFSTELVPLLLGKIYSHINTNIHIDIGTVENLNKAIHIEGNLNV